MDTTLTITTIALSIAFVANIFLGAVVLLQNPRNSLNQSFFALTVAAAVWVLTNLLFAIITDDAVQYPIALISYGSAAALALFFALYCIGLAKITLTKSGMTTLWIVGVVATILSMVPGVLSTDVANNKIVTTGIPLTIYGLYLFTYMSSGIVMLLRARRSVRGNERGRITIVLMGLALAATLGLFFNLILPMSGNYEFVDIGPVATFILAGSSTYAIARHRLFDIKFAAVRTITYAGTLFTLAIVYCLAVYVISTHIVGGGNTNGVKIDPLGIILALVLAFLFQPIKKFYDQLTKNIFYRDDYASSEFFKDISQLLTSTTDLRGLLERASSEIASTFKAEQAFFFLYYTNTTDHHMSAGTPGHARMPLYDTRMLDAHVAKDPSGVVVTELLQDSSEVRRMLRSHHVALVMPLSQGETMTGYIMLGDHRNSNYTKRDLDVLQAVNNELVIAIQNALSLHELKELNATLQQRIDIATKELRASNAQLKHLDEVKDEFISMASHQLRTPLTSIKGYLSMVIDGDIGTITPQQEKVLKEAFNSSERMVRLIADFLNVSRLQTGKFVIEKADIDIKKVVEREADAIRVMAEGHALGIEVIVPSEQVMVHADESKLREVIMNFIDNAIYYSRPNTTVSVRLTVSNGDVVFTVHDTGIGAPEAEQSRLFHKFYRASNARKQRPDGTGVGLYLARRIISAHGGSVVFESVEGKGSTFGFRLPLVRSTK